MHKNFAPFIVSGWYIGHGVLSCITTRYYFSILLISINALMKTLIDLDNSWLIGFVMTAYSTLLCSWDWVLCPFKFRWYCLLYRQWSSINFICLGWSHLFIHEYIFKSFTKSVRYFSYLKEGTFFKKESFKTKHAITFLRLTDHRSQFLKTISF